MTAARVVTVLSLAVLIPAPASSQTINCPNRVWVQQSPDPDLPYLRDVWGVSPTSIYAVGRDGAIVHYDGSAWAPMESPTTQSLNAVWGSSDTEVYAVGDNGTVLRYDGAAWNIVPGHDQRDIVDVHGGGGKVYMAGGGDVLQVIGNWWYVTADLFCGERVSDVCITVNAAWVSDQGNPVLVGSMTYNNGMLSDAAYVWGGGSPGGDIVPPTGSFVYVWGVNESDVYALGRIGYDIGPPQSEGIYRNTGGGWRLVPDQPTSRITRVFGVSSNDVFGLTSSGRLALFDGASWALTADSPGIQATGMWGTSSSDVTIVGGTTIAHWDGDVYHVEGGSSTIGNAWLRDVWAFAPDDAWAVGSGHGVYHYDGAQWTPDPSVPGGDMQAVWASAPSDVFVVGGGGRVVHYDGAQWTDTVIDTTDLMDVYGLAPNDVYAVGAGPASVFHYDGAAWTRDPQQLDGAARSVFVLPDDAFVGTEGGDVYRLHAGSWTQFAGVTSSSIVTMWGVSPIALWLGAQNRLVVTLIDGTTGQVLDTPSIPFGANALWGAAGDDVWAASPQGRIWHFDGALWEPDAFTLAPSLYGIHGSSACDVFAVGAAGTVLYLGDVTRARITGRESDGEVLTIRPGDTVCRTFQMEPRRRGVDVGFSVTGATTASAADVTNPSGLVEACFMPDAPGMHAVVPLLPAAPGADLVADTLTVDLRTPHIRFVDVTYADGDTVHALPGTEVCAGARFDTGDAGVAVDFRVFGASDSMTTLTTDATGAAEFCYAAGGSGWDTLTVAASFDFPSGVFSSVDTMRLYISVPEIRVDRSVHGDADSLAIHPGDEVCTHWIISPPAPGTPVAFSVRGANDVQAEVITGSDTTVVWCYTPTRVGVDTVFAGVGDGAVISVDELALLLGAPRLVVDSPPPDTTGVVPGDSLCMHAALDPVRAGDSLSFDVRGANTVSAVRSVGETGVDFCYPVTAPGLDTVAVSIAFDYGGEVVIRSSGDLVVFTFPPELVVDGAFHPSTSDTLVTRPDGTVCAHFRLEPPLGGVEVTFRVDGVNSTSGVRTTGDDGRVAICYDAPTEGIDAVEATAAVVMNGVVYPTTAGLVGVVRDGSKLQPVVTLSALTPPLNKRVVPFEYTSTKELVDPLAHLDFTRGDGTLVSSEQAWTLSGTDPWVYTLGYGVPVGGALSLSVDAVDAYGNDAGIDGVYDIAWLHWAGALDVRSNDGRIRVTGPSGIVQNDGLLVISHAELGALPLGALIPLSELLTFDTGVGFHRQPTISVSYHVSSALARSPDFDHRRVGFYTRDGNAWVRAGGEGDGAQVSAPLEMPGSYAVFYDPGYRVVPRATVLMQNYPNPFNPTTTIKFDLHAPSAVSLHVYDVRGRLVRTLVRDTRDAGVYAESWDGTNDAGQSVANGVYLYQLRANGVVATRKMLLLK